MKQFKELFEELTKKEQNLADSMTDDNFDNKRQEFLSYHPEANEAFSKYSGRKYTTRVPISITEHSGSPDSEVMKFLSSKNLITSAADYKAGHAFEEKQLKGNPDKGIEPSVKRVKVKIGALLEKHGAPDDIKKAFVNDTFRTGARKTEYDMIISGHPHDVFGMSTGRSWASCASIRDGETRWRGGQGPAAKCMRGELNNHTHVVYLLPKGWDKDLETTQKYANSLLNSHEHGYLKSSFTENWNNHNSLKELINEFF